MSRSSGGFKMPPVSPVLASVGANGTIAALIKALIDCSILNKGFGREFHISR